MKKFSALVSACALVLGLGSALPAAADEASGIQADHAAYGSAEFAAAGDCEGLPASNTEEGAADSADGVAGPDAVNGEAGASRDGAPDDARGGRSVEGAGDVEPKPAGEGVNDSDVSGAGVEQGDLPEETEVESPELMATGFPDVPASHAQYADIMWLASKGITSGWEDGTFKPQGTVTREAMAAFLYRYAGSPEYAPPSKSPFRDLPVGHRFYREISWAAASGLTTGFSDGTFRPSAAVTRGAAAVFLWRLAGAPAVSGVNPFVDVGVCNGQRRGVLWVAATGLAQGYADHTFKPSEALSRAAFAAFLHRYDAKGLGVKASSSAPVREPAVAEAKSFRDVSASNRFAGDIAWLSSTGVSTGYPDATFRPNGAVTRDAFVAFLYRFSGSPAYAPPARSPFKDVATSHPFYREIAWASASGIAGGYSDGTFRPAGKVTRAAAAAFLFRAAGNPASPRSGGFSDTKCSEHRTAISWLAAAGITTGYGGGKYQPNLPVERQAMAAFLHRMCAKGWAVVATPWSKAAVVKDGIPGECIPKPQPAAPATPAVASMATVLAGINDASAREMTQKAQSYSSPSKWLILANQNTARVGIFERRQGRWFLTRYWASGPGAPGTPTRRGVFSVGNRGYSFGSGFTAYYWTQFSGDYLFHSILYYQGTFRVKDGTLGRKVSHGCVRLAIENAKWIYNNIPRGTTVVSY